MTPADALASHRRFMAELGETVLVRRYSGPATARTHIDTPAMARVMDYAPTEIVGPIHAGDQKVFALVDTLAALLPLTTSDKLVIRGREVAIKAVDENTRRLQGTLISLVIQAAG